MKKVFSILLAVSLCFASISVVSAYSDVDDEQKLAEYRQMLEEINEEYDVHLTIQEADEQLFLESYAGMSMDEVRDSIVDSLASLNADKEIAVDDTKTVTRSQDSICANVYSSTQNHYVGYNTYFYLDATISESTSDCVYSSIDGYGVAYPSNLSSSDFYFAPSTKSYALSNASRTCTVTMSGSVRNGKGLTETSWKTISSVFNAAD